MVSLLKNIFGKRELTDAELYASYNKSPKTVKDFDIYIMSIKEGKESIALKEICGINLTNINEIEQLMEILEQNNINKGISLSTNRDKKKLNSIYNQLKEINTIRKNFLPNDERLIHFIPIYRDRLYWRKQERSIMILTSELPTSKEKNSLLQLRIISLRLTACREPSTSVCTIRSHLQTLYFLLSVHIFQR